METGPRLKVSSDRLVKPGIEPATPGLQGKRFIHYTTAAPQLIYVCYIAPLCPSVLSDQIRAHLVIMNVKVALPFQYNITNILGGEFVCIIPRLTLRQLSRISVCNDLNLNFALMTPT